MVKIGKLLMLLLVGTFFATRVFAEVKVVAFVEQNEIGLADTVKLTVSVTSNEAFEATEPKAPPLEGFTLVNSWTSNSTSSKLMQGPSGMQFETIRRQDFNFELTPQRIGVFTIGAFAVTVEGKTYQTQPLQIKVFNSGSGRQKPAPRNVPQQIPGMPSFDDIDEADEMFQQLLQRHGVFGRGGRQLPGGNAQQENSAPVTPPPANKLSQHNPNEAFFVQVELDKVEAYVGEQVTASWYLYTRGNILSLDRLKFPDLKGFWKEIIEEVPALIFQNEVLNGVAYKKALLASHALFPRNPGVASVDEYKVKATVQAANGFFGFGQPYTFTRSSDRVQVKVKPLPTDSKPRDFTGAVGQFEMKAFVESQSFPEHQPFTLKIRFDGAGNAKTIELPELQLPAGFELYDKKSDTKFFKNARSYKEFEILLIPREEGQKVIPALTASMFDPKTGRYYTRTTPAIPIQVTPAANSHQGVSTRLAKQNGKVSSERKDVLPDLVQSFERVGSGAKTQAAILSWLLWIGAIAFLMLRFYWQFSSKRNQQDIRQAYKKRIEAIQKKLAQDQWRAAANEISNLIYFVLGEVSGQGGATQEIEKLLDLSPPSIRRELGVQLKQKVDLFQAIGFAPEALVAKYQKRAELEREFAEVLKILDRALELAA